MIAIGTDILKFERIDEVLGRLGDRFVERILTPEERVEYVASSRPGNLLAKRFAAKEAVAKCLGTGIGRGVSWQDICIVHDENGAPGVVLSGGALEVARTRGGARVLLSLADETDCVVAFAVLS
ncbi:holo-ACP synthase [Halioglobus japonicus]|uniref:Holo-[acyl-carrier-protein] synthase n=1 Tax=Halioglobus japonicus TaxID=930805 RepID=A0AAP8MFI8_9GAMM|nr:holo-ACP synthase [Halioglobus japonicus]AQA18477.1 holo-ACP synthase [Halioglobus japonicus]PLW86494.1 holo-ACP synthase [Halioglobus japonicus]GHD12545.1 holo-[acyl-carrier-protein] synthase [Halioglobus japonicus]